MRTFCFSQSSARSNWIRAACLTIAAFAVSQRETHADVTIHTTYAAWSAAIGGGDAKIDFNLGSAQQVTEQYADLGVHFLPGSTKAGTMEWPSDGWGAWTLSPNFAMTLDFDGPQYGIAADLGSWFSVKLYWQGNLTYQSPQLNQIQSFRGVTSTQPFDRAVFASIPSNATGSLDNIYVSNPVPGPAALTVLTVGALACRRRRTA
jgi:hypothetical protein